MYVNNGKISERQTFRLFVFDLMGIATLLLPPYLAKLCGGDGVYAIALGTGAGLLYLIYLGGIMKKMGKDMVAYLKEEVPPLIGKGTCLLVMLHSIITAGFCAYVFANLMHYSLVSESSYGGILLLIVLVAAYAVSGGIESRARVYEVLFWFILIPYITMMLASVRDVKLAYIKPVLQFSGTNLWQGAYLVFLFLTPLFFALFLIEEKSKGYNKTMTKTIAGSVLVSAGILLGSYLLLVGNFGVKSLSQLRYPVVTLMSTIQFEGNFLKRMDALMLAVWFFTLYALLNLHLHYGVRMLTELFPKNEGTTRWWRVVLPAAAVFGVAYGISENTDWALLFVDYYIYGAVPFMLLAPMFLLLARRKKNEKQ